MRGRNVVGDASRRTDARPGGRGGGCGRVRMCRFGHLVEEDSIQGRRTRGRWRRLCGGAGKVLCCVVGAGPEVWSVVEGGKAQRGDGGWRDGGRSVGRVRSELTYRQRRQRSRSGACAVPGFGCWVLGGGNAIRRAGILKKKAVSCNNLSGESTQAGCDARVVRPFISFQLFAVGLSLLLLHRRKKGSDQTLQADRQLETARWKMQRTGGLAGWAAGMPGLGFT